MAKHPNKIQVLKFLSLRRVLNKITPALYTHTQLNFTEMISSKTHIVEVIYMPPKDCTLRRLIDLGLFAINTSITFTFHRFNVSIYNSTIGKVKYIEYSEFPEILDYIKFSDF